MSDQSPDPCPALLRTQALLDGELSGAAAAQAEHHLKTCALCQSFRADALALGQAIRHELPRPAAPAALQSRVLAALERESPPGLKDARAQASRRRLFWLGWASGLGTSALAVGLALILLLPPSMATLADSIAAAHTSALMSGRTIAVVSSDHHTVKPWFAGRIAISPPVADFAAAGFALAGGRVQKIAGSRAAVVVYRHGKHEIDLFVWAARKEKLPEARTLHGYHLIFWKQEDLDFAAVSDMEAVELEKFVALVKAEGE